MASILYSRFSDYVISEVIGDEAIIMDMNSGEYFSTDGIGAAIWEMVDRQVDQHAILNSIVTSFPHEAGARSDALCFLESLEERRLIARSMSTESLDNETVAIPGAYKPPRLQTYEDMKDLIQLDPIHDVDDAGWPLRRDAA